jgi:GT2 family glycosyltransferase
VPDAEPNRAEVKLQKTRVEKVDYHAAAIQKNATPTQCTMPITVPGMSDKQGGDAGWRPACDLAETFERLAEGLGRPPYVLDLTGDARAGAWGSIVVVFRPPSSGPHVRQDLLPYIDASVDIVAVASPTASLLAEARRVATLAIVDCVPEPRIEWLREPPAARLPSVSVIVPVFNQWPITKSCLQALRSTMPREAAIEVIVADDASTDDTSNGLASLARSEPWLRVVRNDKNRGFVESCNRAAAVATGDVLVFLNNDTVPSPGWLEPLLRTFELFPHVGAVGGKLLFPDGRLQEAGGIVFSDASACHFGRDESNAMGLLFNYVRPVDYVSGALMATPRDLFAALGGFDLDYSPGYYEDTDYCFRLRERGMVVYYQPESAVVHLEGATAGTDLSAGMKRHQLINQDRFRKRHAAALAEQPARPETIDAGSWMALANRGKVRERP